MYDGDDDDDDAWWWCILCTAISFSSAAYLCTKGINIKLLILYSKFWDSKIICVTFFILFALHRYKETFNRDGSTGPLGCPFACSLLRSRRFFACSAHSTACSAQRGLLPRSTVLTCSLARSLVDNGSIWCLIIRLSWYTPPLSTMTAECFWQK